MKAFKFDVTSIMFRHRERNYVDYFQTRITKHSLTVTDVKAVDIQGRDKHVVKLRFKDNLLERPLDSLKLATSFSILMSGRVDLNSIHSLSDWSSVMSGFDSLELSGLLHTNERTLQAVIRCSSHTFFVGHDSLLFPNESHYVVFLLDYFREVPEALDKEEKERRRYVYVSVDIAGDKLENVVTPKVSKSAYNTLMWLLTQPKSVVDDFIDYSLDESHENW